MGFKHEIVTNLYLFAEVEYLNISVQGKKSRLKSFDASLDGRDLSREEVLRAMDKMTELETGKVNISENPDIPFYVKVPLTDQQRYDIKQFKKLRPLLSKEAKFVDDPNGIDEFKFSKSPYSSLGFSIGITYHFGGKSKTKK